ncbi:MAG: acetyl-CoA carboxylase biotin carboxyl carrier protein [Rubricoccaceae bacterium]|nr:acetyl-CoA carboxylase biotin carboxyl carrier protein [Rubricoccaceae bacterium]
MAKMDLKTVERLLEIVAKSGMAEVEVEQDDFKVVVRAHPTAAAPPPQQVVAVPQQTPAPPSQPIQEAVAPATNATEVSDTTTTSGAPSGTTVLAPIVGTFYSSPAPDADPFVKVGDRVEVGTVLCIIEAMKLMNEIQSEHAGVVRQILVENAQPVEFDQPLFVIE